MVKDVDPEVLNAYNLQEWSPDARERLRRFVEILFEWQATCADRVSRSPKGNRDQKQLED